MNTEKPDITSYRTYAIVLVILLALTALSILVTRLELKAWSVAMTMVMACSMAFLILTYFMHLQFDSKLIKLLVALVFLLFSIFIGITLLEYITR